MRNRNMTKVDEALESVLEGYASFLRERMLTLLRHQPYLVRWVQEYQFESSPPGRTSSKVIHSGSSRGRSSN